jgi:hypothetical protein
MNGVKVKTDNGEDVERDEHDDDSTAMDCPFVRIFTPTERHTKHVEMFSRFWIFAESRMDFRFQLERATDQRDDGRVTEIIYNCIGACFSDFQLR